MDRFDASRFYRPWFFVLFALTVFSCDGGGCSGCAGCGVQPIPGAFPIDQRVANAAQVRLTSGGLDFLESNIGQIVQIATGGGPISFPIDETPQDVPVVGEVTLCPGGGCAAQLEIVSATIDPAEPNRLQVHLRLNIDSRNSAGERANIGLNVPGRDCNLNIDTRRDRPHVGVVATIALANTTQSARENYTRLVVENVAIATGEGFEDADLRITVVPCTGFLCDLEPHLCGLVELFGFVEDLLIEQVENQVSTIASTAINDQLCQRQGEFGCPTDTCASDGNADSVCYFDSTAPGGTCTPSADCVPILLGTDGRGDLGGALLGGFSHGTHAYAQFLLAAGGEGEAINQGMSVFFHGGFMGMDRTFSTTAHNSCVPLIEPPLRPTILPAEAFRGNTIPGTATSAHVGIGIAEPFLDYAGYGMFDSGMLCLAAGTRMSQQLSTGLVSALVQSLGELAFPLDNAPLSIAIRPQTPPDFTIGSGTEGDELLQIALNQLQMDFYVWSTERYVRFMTFQSDLVIGVDLTAEGGQIVPAIRRVTAANSSITNSDLLSESPEQLATTLQTILQSFAGMLTSGIAPIDLPALMGFNLEVPSGGITRVIDAEHDNETFLGIFANLSLAAPAPLTAPVETTLELSDLTLDRRSMQAEHWSEGQGNRVWLNMTAQGPRGVEYEYSYRIDGGPWSAWTAQSRLQIDDEILLLQARHEIEARARVLGDSASIDGTPATAELLVDILAPTLVASRTEDGVEVEAEDIITSEENLEYRFEIDGEFTEWSSEPRVSLGYDDANVLVEVRDEVGNVGRAQAALIRGLPDPNQETCGCSAPGSSSSSTPLALLGLFALGALLFRRSARKQGKHLFFLFALLIPLIATGCDCGGPTGPCGDECLHAAAPITRGSVCCLTTDMCADYDLNVLCQPGYTCMEENIVTDESCTVSCAGGCVPKPPLLPGLLATYIDSELDDTGTIFVSGYSPGDPTANRDYGDLVFGSWDGLVVNWEIVDGAPASPITNDPNGYRGGVSAPGDDVGRWTSLVYTNGTFIISYYDATNTALKLAVGGPGSWSIHTVDDTGDSGRYSSMVLTSDGMPAIAYLRIRESPDSPGQIVSSVMVATSMAAIPTGPTDWTISEVTSGPMVCRPELCESAPNCLESGRCVMAASGCSETCASGTVCYEGSCQATVPFGYVEDMPPAYGLYTSLAVNPMGGLALVYYDRTSGNVFGVRYDAGAWGTPFLIDGYAVMDPFIGDSGQGANLTVDASGNMHVAYIDGAEETLRYAVVAAGATTATTEMVDDGSTDGTARFSDGRHIVGDDASIVVLEDGTVRIAYQDATAQDAVLAVRGSAGAWTIQHVDTEASTGYWIDQELIGAVSYLTMWYRMGSGRAAENGIRVFVTE